ncbi:MAG: hypothetical protein U0746_12520 [Gemmataceae bacterium]
MQRVCPRCGAVATNQFLCPTCGRRTVEADADAAGDVAYADGETTFGGGLVIGLVVSQGLTYALRHLAIAGLLWQGSPQEETAFWTTMPGLVVQQIAQGVALAIGAMLAGAGQRRGLAVGATLGTINAALLIGLQLMVRQRPTDILLYSQPVLHAFLGGIAGMLGAAIWRAAPDLSTLAIVEKAPDLLTTTLPPIREIVVAEPLPWGRLFLGTAIAVVGALGAGLIRDLVMSAGGGKGGYEMQQSQFVTWQIALVAIIAGGGIAGSNTRSGALYGFWAGALSSGLLALLAATVDLHLRMSEVAGWILGAQVAEGSPAALVFQGVQTVLAGTLGGWLGSLILPPPAARRRFEL